MSSSYTIHDKNLIDVLCGEEIRDIVKNEAAALAEHYEDVKKSDPKIKFNPEFKHPLDDDILKQDGLLKKLLVGEEKVISYSKANELDQLWLTLMEKAILCLRYFDDREPFLRQSAPRSITAYGLDKLEKYQGRYTDFESLMYGASSYYRDHVFHAFRVWMLGIFCLLKHLGGDDQEILIKELEYILRISICGHSSNIILISIICRLRG